MNKIKELIESYGPTAIVVYYAIFFLSMGIFSVAISFGVAPALAELSAEQKESGWLSYFSEGWALTLGGAWVLCKVIQPLRILLTIAITPWCARTWASRQSMHRGDLEADVDPAAGN